MAGRRALLPLIVAALLPLAGCGSAVKRALNAERAYDQAFAAQRYRQALIAIRKSLSYDENQSRRWLKLGQVQLALNNPAGAADSYQRALDLQPDSLEALENLAILSVRGGRYDMAKRYIEPLLLLQPNDLAGLLASGAVALRERRWDEAQKVAQSLIDLAPERAEGYVLRSQVLAATGKPRQGAELLEARLKVSPSDGEIAQQLMSIYRTLGDREGIRRTAIALMGLFPNDPRYAMESVRAYQAMGKTDQARAIIDRLVVRYGGNASLMPAIAQFWLETLPPEQARARIARAANTPVRRVRIAMAEMLIALGDANRAIEVLSLVANQPVTTANIDVQASYARALYAAGRTAAAQAKVTAILAFDESNPPALLLRARLALARHDYLAASTDAEVVASDDQTNEEAALLVAQIKAAQGNPLLAAKAFGDARQNFPDSTQILRAEADWLIAQRRADEAVQRAGSFVFGHSSRSEAWLAYRDICAKARNTACLAEARRGLARFER